MKDRIIKFIKKELTQEESLQILNLIIIDPFIRELYIATKKYLELPLFERLNTSIDLRNSKQKLLNTINSPQTETKKNNNIIDSIDQQSINTEESQLLQLTTNKKQKERSIDKKIKAPLIEKRNQSIKRKLNKHKHKQTFIQELKLIYEQNNNTNLLSKILSIADNIVDVLFQNQNCSNNINSSINKNNYSPKIEENNHRLNN